MDSVFPPSVLQRLQREVAFPTGVAGGIVGPVGFELRHISGLTAGASHPIAAGGVSYSAADGKPGFRLDADADGTIVVTPLALPVRLDNRPLDGPRQVGNAVLDVGFAGFRVASRRSNLPRPPGTPADRERSVIRRPAPTGDVVVPDGTGERELIRLVRLEYQSALLRARSMWADPEEIMFQIFEQGCRVWSEPLDDPAFGHAAVALGALPWQPDLSRSVDLSAATFAALKEHQALPAVPLVVDLTLGPLGLVGPREMTLAVARQVVLNRAVLSSPRDLAIGVAANRRTIKDWTWIESLPHLTRRPGPRHPLRVLDDPTRAGDPAEIIIATDSEQLPESCSMSLVIGDNGTCTVIDHHADSVTMAATPLGLHPDLATAAVEKLSRLVDVSPTNVAPAPTVGSRSSIGVAPLAMGYESSFF